MPTNVLAPKGRAFRLLVSEPPSSARESSGPLRDIVYVCATPLQLGTVKTPLRQHQSPIALMSVQHRTGTKLEPMERKYLGQGPNTFKIRRHQSRRKPLSLWMPRDSLTKNQRPGGQERLPGHDS